MDANCRPRNITDVRRVSYRTRTYWELGSRRIPPFNPCERSNVRVRFNQKNCRSRIRKFGITPTSTPNRTTGTAYPTIAPPLNNSRLDDVTAIYRQKMRRLLNGVRVPFRDNRYSFFFPHFPIIISNNSSSSQLAS